MRILRAFLKTLSLKLYQNKKLIGKIFNSNFNPHNKHLSGKKKNPSRFRDQEPEHEGLNTIFNKSPGRGGPQDVGCFLPPREEIKAHPRL